MRPLFFGVSLLCASALAQEPTAAPEPIGLKGYFLGAAMEDCPPDALKAHRRPDGTTFCELAVDTLANFPLKSFIVQLWQGKIISVGAELRERADVAPVVAALEGRYGTFSRSGTILPNYILRRGDQLINVSSSRRVVLGVDYSLQKQAQESAAKKNRGDI